MSVRDISVGWIRPLRYVGAAVAAGWIYIAIRMVSVQAVPFNCVSEAIANPGIATSLCGIMWPEITVLKSIAVAILIGISIAILDRMRYEMIEEKRNEEIHEQ